LNSFPDEESLVEAMSKTGNLIGHHACLDFSRMAAADKERRGAFFVISQPGQSAGRRYFILPTNKRQKLIFEINK
jgi:hypothetical protein